MYQFLGLMFKNEKISDLPIRIPALKGSMGGKTYYMMSVEPDILLRIGFVLHRTKVNESMSPTYQRMLIPNRLKDIGKFIDNNGYFPNSIIINFDKGSKVRFESSGGASSNSESRFGTLIIPNAYGIAHIIDGQHRVYGYAGSEYRFTNSIPVVAFYGMESREQLQIFSDINENQKAVRPALKFDLKIDLDWDAPRLDSRIGALRCAIIKELTRDANGVLFNRIAVGEDSGDLSLRSFNDGLSKSSLLPSATYKSYKEEDRDVCLYDCNLTDFNEAMTESKKRVVAFLKSAYEYMQQHLSTTLYEKLISSNRGSYAFIVLLGNLNKHLIRGGLLSQKANTPTRMQVMEPYLSSFANSLSALDPEEYSILINKQGQGAETLWMRKFQSMINKIYSDFAPEGLSQWLETQDKNIQEEGKKIAQEIITILHRRVIDKVHELYGDRWESAISEVRARCKNRINEKEAKDENFDSENADWVDFMEFNDIESIINSKWNDKFEDDPSAITFEQEFSINIGGQFKTKKDKLRWLTELSSFRDSWEKPKANPINRTQVEGLKIVLSSLLTD
ncbi:MAG: DGQHR domain-containing protein [Muribaculaceae bacterium]|nr:DGQHR domain-containing protein [Muribaculaceae bacterium]